MNRSGSGETSRALSIPTLLWRTHTIVGRVEPVPHQQPDRSKATRIFFDAVAGIGIVAAIVADVRDDDVVHPVGLDFVEKELG